LITIVYNAQDGYSRVMLYLIWMKQYAFWMDFQQRGNGPDGRTFLGNATLVRVTTSDLINGFAPGQKFIWFTNISVN